MSSPIGFFAPLPLPMMIPFMGIQSAVMAEQFGTMFQYGKRRISAMSNEEFNALTFETLQSQMTKQIEGMIPEMEKQIQAMQPMVKAIIKEFANYIKLATEALPDVVSQIGQSAVKVGAGGPVPQILKIIIDQVGNVKPQPLALIRTVRKTDKKQDAPPEVQYFPQEDPKAPSGISVSKQHTRTLINKWALKFHRLTTILGQNQKLFPILRKRLNSTNNRTSKSNTVRLISKLQEQHRKTNIEAKKAAKILAEHRQLYFRKYGEWI